MEPARQISSEGERKKPALPPLAAWALEALVLFGLAFLLGPMLARWLDGFGIAFHASLYWLPVAVLALHYGLLSALAAAAIAALLYLIQSGTGIAVGESLAGYALRIGLEPLLWTGAAAILGGVRAQSQERELRLRHELADEGRTVEVMAEHYLRLRDRVESLERALATGSSPALRRTAKLLDDLADLSATACRDQLYEVFSAGANGGEITIYLGSGASRLRLPRAGSAAPARQDLPPAAIFPAPDRWGRTILEVHLDRIDPERFTQTDQVYFLELCERVGALLAQRGVKDLVDIARTNRAA